MSCASKMASVKDALTLMDDLRAAGFAAAVKERGQLAEFAVSCLVVCKTACVVVVVEANKMMRVAALRGALS